MTGPDLPLGYTRVPGPGDAERWTAADVQARPGRLERFRAILSEAGVDAWFATRREDIWYLTGFQLAPGEDQMAGVSGQSLVSADETVVFADSRYRVQAREQSPASRIEEVYNDLPSRWPELVASLRPVSSAGSRVRRIALDAGAMPHGTWLALAAAAPDVELVDGAGWLAELRQVKEPAELERIAASCAVADTALAGLLPSIRPGMTERALALDLEWAMRTSGAEALAFDVACLSGPRAALPHGSPTGRRIAAGEVLLFDFGAQVSGYRSDMTRTLFVGEPAPRDRGVYQLVARAQGAAFEMLADGVRRGVAPVNVDVDAAARDVITQAGMGEHFGHGLGHGIGLATHEAPSLGKRAAARPLPSPTVFSVEPGVYLDDATGVRIEDLVLFDIAAGRCERLTRFPRDITVVGV